MRKLYILLKNHKKIACQINWLMSVFLNLFPFPYGIKFIIFKVNYLNNSLNNCSLKTLINACFGVYESKDLSGVFSNVKFFSFISLDE